MNALALLIVAFGGAFALVWLLHYVPLRAKLFGGNWSPRLTLCRALAPFDAVITFILVAGAWVGFTSVTGIGMMMYNVMTGIGLSIGVLFTQKKLVPRWEEQYKQICGSIDG